ncbi:MAG: permease-like cell division protein FtsX [Oscillospiraceae bacterium]|nr:permease-like cell division protein FtsX [Oscillospiraceae bacterium]MBR7084102.1 permease-like cell division protein FtsX [Oscillospiraceae bacterium]
MKFSGICYLTRQGIENIWKNRMMAFASFCVLLVSLLLVGTSILAYQNITSIVGGVEAQNEIIVYMQEDVTPDRLTQIEYLIQNSANVAEVQFSSKEEEYLSLKERMGEYDVLFDALGEDNPLVDSFRVKIQDISQMNKTISEIQQLEGVLKINAPYEFVSFLTQLRTILTWVMSALIIAMIIVSMVIISNTTRTSVYARREEIHIMKYVGATDAFIRVPFFIEGMVTGFFSGCAALVITWLVYTSVVDMIENQVTLLNIIGIGSIIQFESIYLYAALAYMLGGALIGAVGSALSTRKYINV